MSCNMSSVWPLADGRRDSGHTNTSVTAQRVGLWTAFRNQVPVISAVAETWLKHVNRNRAESHFRVSFGSVMKAVSEIRSASATITHRRENLRNVTIAGTADPI